MIYEQLDNNKGSCSPSLPVFCHAFQHIHGAWKVDLHTNILTWITFSVGLPSREVMFLLVSQTTPGPSHPTSPLETVPQSCLDPPNSIHPVEETQIEKLWYNNCIFSRHKLKILRENNSGRLKHDLELSYTIWDGRGVVGLQCSLNVCGYDRTAEDTLNFKKTFKAQI